METPQTQADIPQEQEKDKKRSPWLIVLLILLILMMGCCIIGAILCRGTNRLPDFLDRILTEIPGDETGDNDFWGFVDDLIKNPQGFLPNTVTPEVEEFPPEDEPILFCPKEETEYSMGISHKWDYSPGRDLEQMKIDGWTDTDPFPICSFTIKGSTVTFPDCTVNIFNRGFSWPGEGVCEYDAIGTATISVRDASCSDGNLTMTIVETWSPLDGSGEQNCEGMIQPWYPTFPLSETTVVFDLGSLAGVTAVQTPQDPVFSYTKAWTVWPAP